MALYHLQWQNISRGKGKNSVSAAAYRAGDRIKDENQGITFDYSGKKENVFESTVMAPENAPEWAKDYKKLWNEVEKRETNKDGSLKLKARLCYEMEISLQTELSKEENVQLAKSFVEKEFVSKGHVAHISFHDMDSHNPHCHVQFTTREITPEGFGKKNDRELMAKDYLEKHLRPEWEKHLNEKFKEKGLDIEVSSKSYKDQGIDKEPTKHLPHRRDWHDEKFKEVFSHNMSVEKRNREREQLTQEKKQIQKDIIFLEKEVRKMERQQLRAQEDSREKATVLRQKKTELVSDRNLLMEEMKYQKQNFFEKHSSPTITRMEKKEDREKYHASKVNFRINQKDVKKVAKQYEKLSREISRSSQLERQKEQDRSQSRGR